MTASRDERDTGSGVGRAIRLVKRVVASLAVGALFGWAMALELPTPHAVGTGAVAAVVMYVSLASNARWERREASRATEDGHGELS